MNEERAALRLVCRGVVQGVGFRPAVSRLAAVLGLAGTLTNVSGAVTLELAGPRADLIAFLERLPQVLAPPARLDHLEVHWLRPPLPEELASARGLRITAAPPQPLGEGWFTAALTADLAPCPDCLAELTDPSSRRCGYPFLSCSRCGPRYSIATAEPWCRAHTTLAAFPLCSDCRAEFEDPADRRFHAETIACPRCGPRLRLLDGAGRPVPGPPAAGVCRNRAGTQTGGERPPKPAIAASHAAEVRAARAQAAASQRPGARMEGEHRASAPLGPRDGVVGIGPLPRSLCLGAGPLAEALALLRDGGILALQGVGGFQLLVNAVDPDAVARLRRRKHRPHKPFALLVDDPVRLADLLQPTAAELAALRHPAAPIVLLPCPQDLHARALAGVAPGAPALGVMLPASPLHQLLAAGFAGPLVATSGNRSGEPLCRDPGEAVERLAGLADAFLVHDRPIARSLEDSVLQILDGRPALLRRARGYCPEPLSLAGGGAAPAVLALGGDLRSAPALAIGDRLWLAPYLGDLADARIQERWLRGLAEVRDRLGEGLAVVAVDRHPQYISRQLACRGLPGLPPRSEEVRSLTASSEAPWPDPAALRLVAHHRAHALAVVAEHGLTLPVKALVLDGLGYGEGPVPLWGCELLALERDGARRLATLRPFPLPGGERAVREPRRSALGLLVAAGLLAHPGAEALQGAFGAGEIPLLLQAIETGCHSPWCSSAGRLFDAVAALLDLVQRASHDAQAGLWLQCAAERAPSDAGAYPLPLRLPDGDGVTVPGGKAWDAPDAGPTRMAQAPRLSRWVGASPDGLARQAPCREAPPPDAPRSAPVPMAARGGIAPALPLLDWQPLLQALLDDRAAGGDPALCAARFHGGLIEGLAEAALTLLAPGPGDAPVVLAGGCFQNRRLLEGLIAALRRRGLRPFWGERIPLNDGGLAVGQVLALRPDLRPAVCRR